MDYFYSENDSDLAKNLITSFFGKALPILNFY